jgi:tetratricopeptide (TPR) repeat protein
MTREEWRRIKRIAEDAWDLPESERTALLSIACADDEVLRREVESLLRSAADASGLYEDAALSLPGAAEAFDRATGSSLSLSGARVGPYRVVREIGRGGMGSVYLAERADGAFEQRTAIKLIGGMPTDVLLRRFREERRILAALDHPNIARLIDGGTTADGLPYVVMEYVSGVGIEDFCHDRRLTVRARIELFRQVCAAVQYAHQHLVIHRDIKASNILVTPDGTPKLLDFGIAKLVDPVAEGDGPTVTMARTLTLEAASPEQVRGGPITVAADIYALGVLLYRLLARRSPYGLEVSSETALMRAICDEVPQSPSAALAASADGSLRGERIDRDIDLIVLKALRKEPERRYQSVQHLSDDLLRYLDGQPVLAAPDSVRYRAAKFLRRHRVSAAGAFAALVAVLAGAGVATYQAHVAGRERARADRRFNDVRRLANSFLFEFHDAIADLPGSLKARQIVVKRAAEYLDSLAHEAQGDVALQRELAMANERLGTILGGGGVSNLGDLQGADARYQIALSIRETLASRASADAIDVEGLAQLRVQLARFLALRGNLGPAEESARHAVVMLESPDAASNRSVNRLGQLATAYHQLGYVQARRGENAAALDSLERAVDSAKRQLGLTPHDLDEGGRLARIQIDYADQLLEAGRPADSFKVLTDARRTFGDLLVNDPLNVRYRQNLVRILDKEGDAREAMGDRAGSIDALSSGVAAADALRVEAPEDHANQLAAMISHSALGMALVRAGQREAGIRRLHEAIAEGEAIIKAAPGDDFTVNEVAETRLRLGETLLTTQSQSQEGCREIGEGLALWKGLDARAEVPGESAKDRGRFESLWTRCRVRARERSPGPTRDGS